MAKEKFPVFSKNVAICCGKPRLATVNATTERASNMAKVFKAVLNTILYKASPEASFQIEFKIFYHNARKKATK